MPVGCDDRPALTLRSLAIGTGIVVAAVLGALYSRQVLHSTRLAQNHLSLAVVFPFTLIVVFLARPLRMSRGELLVIFCMGLVASTLPTYFLSKLIAIFTVPHYLAEPANQWAEYTHEHLPRWAVMPRGPALIWYFEGLPRGQTIPWGDWAVPLFWWMSLVVASFIAFLCVVVLLRRPWVEHERLDYPLMELAESMLEGPRRGLWGVPFMGSPAFWVGFGVSAFGILWNILSYFNPVFPAIPRRFAPIHLGQEFPPIDTNLYWPIVGFGYFIKLDIGFSIWFFYLLAVLEEGLFNRVGFALTDPDLYGTSFVAGGWQSLGAFTAIVLWGVYVARDHLRGVLRKALRGDPTVDDTAELMSYRAAVLGLSLSALYMLAWHCQSGMSLSVALIFTAMVFITYIGITRIIAETGLITIRAPIVAQHFTFYTLGTVSIPASALVALGLSYGWYGDMKTTLMPALAHSARLFDALSGRKRQFLWPLAIAMAVGTAASVWFIIFMGYRDGAFNYGGQLSGELSRWPWNIAVERLRNPVTTDYRKIGFFFVGIAFTAILYALRYRFPGWPLHPLGLAAGASYPVTNVVFPLFLAWGAKALILRLGGIRLYRTARPFFLGLILGYYFAAGISFFVDMIWFPGEGHDIPFSD